MDRFSFTVLVEGLDQGSDRYADDLYKAGCDDALVSVSEGRVTLDFDRFASSYDEAVASAKRNVERAGGRVVAVEQISE